jgi:carbamoyl-phosphate synthase large subunit
MPKRSDIKSILIIGAGPIVIGQAVEFDYSGAQACKALREEGYKVILVNSNPATIMTDPETADVTYIEPITWKVGRAHHRQGTSGRDPADHGRPDRAELRARPAPPRHPGQVQGRTDRRQRRKPSTRPRTASKFKDAMTKIGLGSARSGIAHSMEEARTVQRELGFPSIIRPSFTMGGSGGGIAYNEEEFDAICKRGLEASPTSELLIEESLLGWKEYEMEVVRDKNDNCIIICSIENLDPMGVHTGDSITVAPAQTLTDKEYQIMRNASIAVLREIGVDTGGSNVQFSINPAGRPHDRHRDEPARVAFVGAGIESHRLPDRQSGGQAGGRLHARRAAQRDHRRRDPGLVRTVDRLRRQRSRASPSRNSRPPTST